VVSHRLEVPSPCAISLPRPPTRSKSPSVPSPTPIPGARHRPRIDFEFAGNDGAVDPRPRAQKPRPFDHSQNRPVRPPNPGSAAPDTDRTTFAPTRPRATGIRALPNLVPAPGSPESTTLVVDGLTLAAARQIQCSSRLNSQGGAVFHRPRNEQGMSVHQYL
jgi:hypothetical protein